MLLSVYYYVRQIGDRCKGKLFDIDPFLNDKYCIIKSTIASLLLCSFVGQCPLHETTFWNLTALQLLGDFVIIVAVFFDLT